MKIKDLLFTYQNKLNKLEKIAKYYYDKHYCGYMEEWINGSEEEYLKLRQDVENYLDSELEL